MPQNTEITYNNTNWIVCECGWTCKGADNGRSTKKLAQRLHARKCEFAAYFLEHPTHINSSQTLTGVGRHTGGRTVVGTPQQTHFHQFGQLNAAHSEQ